MNITEDQQKILDTAIELLKKYDKEDVTDWIYYFVVSEDNYEEISPEYDCCDNQECYEKTLKELRKESPYCIYLYQDNGGDHENINYCYQCGKPLNDTLTWIEQELDHHTENNLEKKCFQVSGIAFEIRVMFKSFPSIDYEISDYDKTHPESMVQKIKMQKKFTDRVINYAKQIILILKEGEICQR